MSVTQSEIQAFACLNPPTSDATTLVGGGRSTTRIYGITPGEVHYTTYAYSTGGGDKSQTSKIFVYNSNATDSAVGVMVFGLNVGQDFPMAGQPQVVGADETFTSSMKLRWLGFASNGDAQQGETYGNGSTAATASEIYGSMSRVELRDKLTNALIPAPCEIYIKLAGVTYATIPKGMSTATWEITIGWAPTAGDTATVALATTAPPVSVSRAYSLATAIALPGGTLAALTGWGLWSVLTTKERAKPSAHCTVRLRVRILAT